MAAPKVMGQGSSPLGVRSGAHDWGTFAELKLAQADLVQGKPTYYHDQKLKEGKSTLVSFLKFVLLNGVIWMEKKKCM